MTQTATVLGHTTSVCPVCLQTLPAAKVAYPGEGVYLEKTCPQHGDFRVLIWKGEKEEYLAWGNPKPPVRPRVCDTQVEKGCPYDCGLCPDHAQQTCCVLLEVTPRCNLRCPTCFACATDGEDPSMQTIAMWYDSLARQGKFNIQLSGGEPTVRDDLPDIIRLGRAKGFDFFQLNTNGLRLGEDAAYLEELVRAGASCAFLQFDALTDDVYEKLRGQRLLDRKLRAIDACAKAGLGVVLVPTVVRGVNDHQLGDLLRFALQRLPEVKGVHFQPVSYFGRYDAQSPPVDRLTLPELMDEIERQTDGLFRREHFSGGNAENAYCSFHGNFLLMEDGELRPLKAETPARRGCCDANASQQSRETVARRWSREALANAQPEASGCCCDAAPEPTCCDAAPEASDCCCDAAPEPTCCCDTAPEASGCCDAQPEPGCCCDAAPEPSCCDAAPEPDCCCDAPAEDLFEVFLNRLKNYTLAVSCMAFQDAWTLDLDRLRECYICEVNPDGRLVPFCAYNMTDVQGRSLYRRK